MNPDTGYFEIVQKGDEEHRLSIRKAMEVNVKAIHTAIEESHGVIPPDHPLILTLKDRMKILADLQKGPFFTRGEFLVIRGVAFKVVMITPGGMLLKPVRDQTLIDMVNKPKE